MVNIALTVKRQHLRQIRLRLVVITASATHYESLSQAISALSPSTVNRVDRLLLGPKYKRSG